MTTIPSTKFSYNPKTKTFLVNGKDVSFGTKYELENLMTGGRRVFHFNYSTGSEWDPNTKWIYKSTDGEYTLEVGNEDVTPAHAEAYLKAKLKN